MVNQQKQVQQETAYSTVDHMYPCPCLYHFFMFLCPFWVKNDIGTGIIHYNCTIGSFLLHLFLLVCVMSYAV